MISFSTFLHFSATATLGHQVLFKDTIVMQLCEEGAVSSPPPRPTLTTIHQQGIIFRDDFDSMPWFNPDLWSVMLSCFLLGRCVCVFMSVSMRWCVYVVGYKCVCI